MYEVELTVKTATIELSTEDNASIELTATGGDRLPYYEGNYNVTPSASLQVLNTANRSMTDNVAVFSVPYQAVENPAGGLTATIL